MSCSLLFALIGMGQAVMESWTPAGFYQRKRKPVGEL